MKPYRKNLGLSLGLLLSVLLALATPNAIAEKPRTCITLFESISSPEANLEFKRLRAGDRSEWKAWLNTAFTDGIDPTEGKAITAILADASEATKTQIRAEVRAQYTTLKKAVVNGPEVGPKRVADLLINALIRPEQIFARAAERGYSVEIALQIYFREVNKILGPAIGPAFSTNEVRSMVEILQKRLRAQFDSRSGNSRSITLFGSTPNGRGRPGKSDIDLSYGEGLVAMPVSGIRDKINMALRQRKNSGIMEIEEFRRFNTTSHLATINPVQIHITRDSVEIHVYPQRTKTDGTELLKPVIYKWF